MAAIDAYQRDYDVVVVSDCVSSNDRNHHQVTLDYVDGHICQVIPLEKLSFSSI
jgi:isochorismate hydrolase